MSRVLVTVMLALTLLFQLPVVEASDWSRIVKMLRTSTVPIACSEHQQNVCTAFSINRDQGLYMTAFHCTEEFMNTPREEGAKAEFPTLFDKPLEVIYANKALDLAILKAEVKKPALRYRTRPLEVGNEVGAYGYGMGMAVPIFRSAIVSVFLRDEAGTEWVLLDNSLVQGMSGGPIVDRSGRVIGVNDKTNRESGMTLSIAQILAATQFWASE